jgi:hypothetical protein
MSGKRSRGVDGEFADGRYEYASGRAKGHCTSEFQIGIEFDVQ